MKPAYCLIIAITVPLLGMLIFFASVFGLSGLGDGQGEDPNANSNNVAVSDGVLQTDETGFNKDHIIEDEDFINIGTMDEQKIQSFLEKYHGSLVHYESQGLSASRIIYQAAQNNRLNPQVILTRLELEQGLITGKKFSPEQLKRRLDFAMGYGCPHGQCNPKYAGFKKQVDSGSKLLRRSFDQSLTTSIDMWRVGSSRDVPDVDLAGHNMLTTVKLTNRATATLYKYSPEIRGAKLFYTIFKRFFLQGE